MMIRLRVKENRKGMRKCTRLRQLERVLTNKVMESVGLIDQIRLLAGNEGINKI